MIVPKSATDRARHITAKWKNRKSRHGRGREQRNNPRGGCARNGLRCEQHTLLSHGSVGETLLTFPGARAISTPPGTSGLFAFEMEWDNDGYDTIKRWPRRPPQAAFIPLLASRYPRDGS